MKVASSLLRSAAVAATVMLASALPSKAATFTLSDAGGPGQTLNIGDQGNFAHVAVTNSPFSDSWFFNVMVASIVNAFASVSNSPNNINPLTLAIFRDTNGNNVADAGDAQVATNSGNFSVNLITSLISPGNYYVKVSGPFTAGDSGAISGNVAIGAVPLPPALLLFGSGLAGLGMLARRRRKQNTSGFAA